jgi:hypothetical protein
MVQVGGGALASACMQAYARALAAGLVASPPRIHTVQTQGAAPLRRAWTLLQERCANTGAAAEDGLRYAVAHRSAFMWPWEDPQHSIASGILDPKPTIGRIAARDGRDGRRSGARQSRRSDRLSLRWKRPV